MARVYVLGPGGQYNHLIARRVAELNYDARIKPVGSPLNDLADASAIIVGGGPGRLGLGDPASEQLSRTVREAQVPVLGICYGHQFIASVYGGKVSPAVSPEFGPAELRVVDHDYLFSGLPDAFTVWMSHNDEVVGLPKEFRVLGKTDRSLFQAVLLEGRPVYGVQFHVEVEHTSYGREILSNFLTLGKR